jgi:hypothetical protein
LRVGPPAVPLTLERYTISAADDAAGEAQRSWSTAVAVRDVISLLKDAELRPAEATAEIGLGHLARIASRDRGLSTT